MTSEEQGNYVDLVFEGGGIKGIALVGALSVLLERGFQPQNIAGTSSGAIVATLLAAGYSAEELRRIIAGQEFERFKDRGWEDRIPVLGTPLSILKDQGIYEGDAFAEWLRGLLEAKEVRTFGDLVHPAYADEARYRYRVQVIASDITTRRLLVLPHDAPRLGVEPDDLDVALAVRMSASIPIYFEPVRFRNPRTGKAHIIVDGGLLSNFPVWLFDSPGVPPWPTFGLLLVEPEPRAPLGERLPSPEAPPVGLNATVDFLRSMALTVMEARDRRYVETADFARTIPIPTLGISAVDFDLPPERVEALYQAGRRAAEGFLERWSFDGYIREFRTGKEYSRRAHVAGLLR